MCAVFGCAIGQGRVFVDYECSLHIDLHRSWMGYGAVNCGSTVLMPIMLAGFFGRVDALGFTPYCCHGSCQRLGLRVPQTVMVYAWECIGIIVRISARRAQSSVTNSVHPSYPCRKLLFLSINQHKRLIIITEKGSCTRTTDSGACLIQHNFILILYYVCNYLLLYDGY